MSPPYKRPLHRSDVLLVQFSISKEKKKRKQSGYQLPDGDFCVYFKLEFRCLKEGRRNVEQNTNKKFRILLFFKNKSK